MVSGMVLQTNPVFPFSDCVGGEIQRAGAQRIDAVYRIENHFLDVDRCVWTEIGGTVTDSASGRYDSREGFVADDDPWVGLVVFEQNVVSGLKVLDQAVFEQERFVFGGNHRVAQIGDPGDHDPYFGALVGFRSEIGGYAAFEILSFTDIDYFAVGPEKLIYARRIRQERYFLFQSGYALRWGHGEN